MSFRWLSLAAALGGLLPLLGTRAAAPEYRALRAAGDPSEAPGAWDAAPSIRWGEAPYATRFAALWNDEGMWLRFEADDIEPWHRYAERDDPIWEEEVVEIFIDPDGDGRDYVEIEISPANVVTDLLMARGEPDRSGDIGWDFAGLRSRVQHRDGGWTALAWLPWSGFGGVTGAKVPPRAGDAWRFNVFRIKRPGGPESPQHKAIFAAWQPPPGPSFHVPEVFGLLRFERSPTAP